MNFEQAVTEANRIIADARPIHAALRAFPRNAIGLVADEVRVTAEYQAALRASQRAFAAERAANAVVAKLRKAARIGTMGMRAA